MERKKTKIKRILLLLSPLCACHSDLKIFIFAKSHLKSPKLVSSHVCALSLSMPFLHSFSFFTQPKAN